MEQLLLALSRPSAPPPLPRRGASPLVPPPPLPESPVVVAMRAFIASSEAPSQQASQQHASSVVTPAAAKKVLSYLSTIPSPPAASDPEQPDPTLYYYSMVCLKILLRDPTVRSLFLPPEASPTPPSSNTPFTPAPNFDRVLHLTTRLVLNPLSSRAIATEACNVLVNLSHVSRAPSFQIKLLAAPPNALEASGGHASSAALPTSKGFPAPALLQSRSAPSFHPPPHPSPSPSPASKTVLHGLLSLLMSVEDDKVLSASLGAMQALVADVCGRRAPPRLLTFAPASTEWQVKGYSMLAELKQQEDLWRKTKEGGPDEDALETTANCYAGALTVVELTDELLYSTGNSEEGAKTLSVGRRPSRDETGKARELSGCFVFMLRLLSFLRRRAVAPSQQQSDKGVTGASCDNSSADWVPSDCLVARTLGVLQNVTSDVWAVRLLLPSGFKTVLRSNAFRQADDEDEKAANDNDRDDEEGGDPKFPAASKIERSRSAIGGLLAAPLDVLSLHALLAVLQNLLFDPVSRSSLVSPSGPSSDRSNEGDGWSLMECLLDLCVCKDVKCQALALGAILSLVEERGSVAVDEGRNKVIREMLADGIALGAISSCF